MRVLITICLLAVVYAERLGYNYQPVDQPISYTPSAVGQASYIPPAETGATEPGFGAPAPAEQSYQAPAELLKEFFTYTADERDFNEPINQDQLSNNLRKNLRVVFIKGPEYSGVQDAALALSKQAAEQQTAIYVLNKQADINDLGNKLNNIRSNTYQKPQVHFVKYRTTEDAINAQRAIQGQYDQLGGVSINQDGGVASVLNFASRTPAQAAPAVHEPLNSYLPASVLRSRL
ncbi:uncharacterized protein [Drosophila virilis]|uniref:DUF243 domain-containing protein n=1 Tax=Drosophila virilis TaxID=7244 RepID=B4MC35_DROVI|nr:uncharacterized protein LOC6635045 [Drosophila virilis]EDW58656.1 uncharacterized protein Dvir_GJ14175 [Drosophila virilis]